MPNPAQQGARDFVFWHWSQLVFRNPRVQVLKFDNISVAPFALAYLSEFLVFSKAWGFMAQCKGVSFWRGWVEGSNPSGGFFYFRNFSILKNL